MVKSITLNSLRLQWINNYRALKLEDIDDSILDKYITEYDINGDGEIDYNELLNLMGKLSLK